MFRKVKLDLFLIIKKAYSMFQCLHALMSNDYPDNEGRNVSRKVKKWIRWIPQINRRFKLIFDGLRINNINALGWVIRDSNGIIKIEVDI